MTKDETIRRVLASRRDLVGDTRVPPRSPDAAEGGCGVLGLACNVPIAGRHLVPAAAQMHNRGNGKGGGIAVSGLDPEQMGVSSRTLREAYLIQIAYLDPEAQAEVEKVGLADLDILTGYRVPTLDDWQGVQGLEVRPPDVWRYFARVEAGALARFAEENGLEAMSARALEDEFIYQNSVRLNTEFYASLGERRAFVLCHGRDLIVLKIVGYAEQVVKYYRLEDVSARVWIAHQRYPTKGRVWHPGGAHPFIGLNEALVHNGDFANYHAVSEYLSQRNIRPLFLTDTEVSVQLFDLWDRVYEYPLEVTLEALAPTTERDFEVLPPDKQALYRAVQAAHLHASPDGPWFFIIARSHPGRREWQLLGITDTSMLRPQVFALFENDGVEMGLIGSERQAINAAMRSLAAEDNRFLPVADKYWPARGGSHTDGGAFSFSVREEVAEVGTAPGKLADAASYRLDCRDKFGTLVEVSSGRRHVDRAQLDLTRLGEQARHRLQSRVYHAFDDGGPATLFRWAADRVAGWSYDEVAAFATLLVDFGGAGSEEWEFARTTLTLLRDRHYGVGEKRRASLLTMVDTSLVDLFEAASKPVSSSRSLPVRRLSWGDRHRLCSPQGGEAVLVVDALQFPPQGADSAARLLVEAYDLGWRHLVVYNWRGGRFAGCGLGKATHDLRLDLYGDVGDYAASGLDGAALHIHGAAQDQVGQILKRGKLVVHGDVGQAFLYGAKGGEIYVLGSAAGRPLINAVGRPRVVINGTCLDYLAESFMAGDPLNGGGFAILNGVAFDERGRVRDMESPYPGGSLFSLASGGAIYLRDPRGKVSADQLNGGRFADLTKADWSLIQPYLKENERLFGIEIARLLTVNGRERAPSEVYRKVEAQSLAVLK